MDFDIGVIRKEAIAARSVPLSVAATEAFALGVAKRYALQATTVSCGDLALAWETSAEANYYYGSHSVYFGSPRIEVFPRVTVEERYLSDGSRGLTGTPAGGGRQSLETEANVLFERIFSRQTRVVAFDSQLGTFQLRGLASSGQRRIENPLRSEAVERILPLAAAAQKPALVEPSSKVPFTTRDVGWGTPLTTDEPPKPLTLPPAEVKRVADHVIREIEHRITARKERMGKR